MALLNMSEVLLDPLLTSKFHVERRSEVISDKGRAVITPQIISNVVGVVTAANPNDLERLDGYEITQRAITIVTKFRLQGEVTSKQPDVIQWKGSRYIVKIVDYYPQFGNGFIQADCVSMDMVDGELPPWLPGEMKFNNQANSALATL